MKTSCPTTEAFIVASYSKYKTKAAIKTMLAENPTRPPIDLMIAETGQMTSPEEMRRLAGITYLPVTNQQRTWFGAFRFNEKTKAWKFT